MQNSDQIKIHLFILGKFASLMVFIKYKNIAICKLFLPSEGRTFTPNIDVTFVVAGELRAAIQGVELMGVSRFLVVVSCLTMTVLR